MLMTKKTKITMKPPPQSPSAPVSNLMFEGVYNNARMLHFLTAVVGSTCDVRVKNGSVYEGVFKTLSSVCELAVDAVHKCSDGGGVVDDGGGAPWRPQVEDITDTMVFSPSDLVTMTCRDVDLSFAVRDSFTDPSIGSVRLNGDHREKVLQRWDGDGNGENYELESETSNGWDANDMFKFNEDTYGVKSTYDSSLSSYTMPLERGNSEVYRQREARAARLANEIESSAQYCRRVSLENDEGRSDEDKYSAVVRGRDDRGGASTRDSKCILLPQRTRDVMRGGASGRPSAPPTSSPKVASDRSSPLSIRPASSSPPCTSHALPHSLSHPQALNDSSHSHVNGVSSRTSPQSHRPPLNRTQNHRTLVSQSSPAGTDSDPLNRTSGPVPAGLTRLVVLSASHAPKPDFPPHLNSSPSVTTATSSTSLSGPAPLFPVDVNEILNSASKDRTDSGSGSGPQDGKNSRVPLVQQRSQLEELRKFGKEFRLQSSLLSVDPPPPPPDSTSPPKPFDLQPSPEMAPPTSLPAAALTPPCSRSEVSQSRTPHSTPLSSDESSLEINERTEAATAATAQVKNSTLNPNAKEFQPVKGHYAVKSVSAPPPRPTPPSPSVVLNSSPPAGQPGGGTIYSSPPGPYLSYVSPLPLQGHSLQGQLYQYAMSTVTQGKYPRPRGAVVSSRPDHASSSIISAPSAGPPLVSPYAQSYLQYGQVIQTVAPPYHGQTVYSMLHGGARLLTSGAPPPQPMGPPSQQYPGPTEGPGGPQQGLYAAQSFSHHSGAIHHPQPSATPTGTQAPPQHPAPSPGHSQSQTSQAPPPSMFHSGPLSTPTPPGHASAQTPYPVQGYSLNPHQTLAHGFTSISQITQAHVSAGLSGPHHPTGHGHPPVMLHYAPSQQAGGSAPQQGPTQHFYIGPHQAVQVQTHPSQTLTFHPSAN